MTDHGHEHDWRPVPILPYRDAAVTAAFWTRSASASSTRRATTAYLIAVRDGAELHFVDNPDLDPAAGWFAATSPSDVDALHGSGRPRPASEGLSSLARRTEPWGLREMWLTDPDGTVVRLGARPEATDEGCRGRGRPRRGTSGESGSTGRS